MPGIPLPDVVWMDNRFELTMNETKQTSASSCSWQSISTNWSVFVLRAMVGYGFMAHGFAKLSRGEPAFAAILAALGVPRPHLMAWVTILVELIGGFAVLIGAFVRTVSIPMTAVLLVAALTVHLQYGFSSIKLVAVNASGPRFGPPGYETALLYIACLVAIALGGPGRWSIDGWIARLTARRAGGEHASERNPR
jgi:putative oxidoreductase